jgi:hypothetical protein
LFAAQTLRAWRSGVAGRTHATARAGHTLQTLQTLRPSSTGIAFHAVLAARAGQTLRPGNLRLVDRARLAVLAVKQSGFTVATIAQFAQPRREIRFAAC